MGLGLSNTKNTKQVLNIFNILYPYCPAYNAKLDYILVLSNYNIGVFKQIYYQLGVCRAII